MDLSNAPIAIALISLSGALIKTAWNGKKNNSNCYVNRDECHTAMDGINQRIADSKESLHKRIDDVCDKVDLVVTLLKNGK